MFKCLFIKQFNWESIIFPIRWWNKNSFGAKHLFHIGVKLTRWRRFPRRLWESVNNRYQRVSQCRFQVQKTVKFPKGKLVVTHSSNYLMNENSLETVIGFKSKFFDPTPQWKFLKKITATLSSDLGFRISYFLRKQNLIHILICSPCCAFPNLLQKLHHKSLKIFYQDTSEFIWGENERSKTDFVNRLLLGFITCYDIWGEGTSFSWERVSYLHLTSTYLILK